jgi:hypothetical protein
LFEIKQLHDQGPYPEEAIRVSQRAFATIFMLVDESVEGRNKGVFTVAYYRLSI